MNAIEYNVGNLITVAKTIFFSPDDGTLHIAIEDGSILIIAMKNQSHFLKTTSSEENV